MKFNREMISSYLQFNISYLIFKIQAKPAGLMAEELKFNREMVSSNLQFNIFNLKFAALPSFLRASFFQSILRDIVIHQIFNFQFSIFNLKFADRRSFRRPA